MEKGPDNNSRPATEPFTPSAKPEGSATVPEKKDEKKDKKKSKEGAVIGAVVVPAVAVEAPPDVETPQREDSLRHVEEFLFKREATVETGDTPTTTDDNTAEELTHEAVIPLHPQPEVVDAPEASEDSPESSDAELPPMAPPPVAEWLHGMESTSDEQIPEAASIETPADAPVAPRWNQQPMIQDAGRDGEHGPDDAEDALPFPEVTHGHDEYDPIPDLAALDAEAETGTADARYDTDSLETAASTGVPGGTLDMPLPTEAERHDLMRPSVEATAGMAGTTGLAASAANRSMPTGYERTPADVSRAAAASFGLGYFVGRLRKNRAVRRAVDAAERRFKVHKPVAPAPVRGSAAAAQAVANSYPANLNPNLTPAAGATIAERLAIHPQEPALVDKVRLRTAPKPEWIRSESLLGAVKALDVEKIRSSALTELLAAPAAVVALKAMREKPLAVSGARTEAALSRGDMLHLAKDIRIDGIPLREIYESKQIDEAGMRAVVETFLRGGDVARQTRIEVAETQKRFERDPFNRQRRHSGGGLKGAISTAASSVIEKGAELAKSTGQAASKAGQSIALGAKQSTDAVANSSEQQQWMSVGAVAVIWAAILLLIVFR